MTRREYYTCLHCGEGEMLCDIAAKTYDDKFVYTCEACGHSRRMLAFEDFEKGRREVLAKESAAGEIIL